MAHSSVKRLLLIIVLLCAAASGSERMGNAAYRYAVVVRDAAYSDAGWKAVADSLIKKHGKTLGAKLFTWSSSVTEVKGALSAFKPDYIGFVCRPVADVNSAFINDASVLTRGLDADPYTDAVWAIVTGYAAADALRAIKDSLIVKTTLSGYLTAMTNPTPANAPQRWFYQSIATFEPWQDFTPPWNIDQLVYNLPNGSVKTMKNDPSNIVNDRIVTFSNWLNAQSLALAVPGGGSISGPVDLFTTSGHGNVNVWQAHYPTAAPEGYLISQNGQLYGSPNQGSALPINCKTPKVYCATGNCLIGNPDNLGNLPYAWFHTGRCVQMFGYIIETNYEYLGWGQWYRFSEFPGVCNVAESWFITHNSMMLDYVNKTPGVYNQALMEQFMNTTVVYGDPKAIAYLSDLGDSSHPYLEKFTRVKGAGQAPDTFEYTATGHLASGAKGDVNPFCYGLRPFKYLPVRIDPASVKVVKNDGHTAVITENFMLWSMLEGSSDKLNKGSSKTLRWTAKTVEELTPVQTPVAQAKRVRAQWTVIPLMKTGVIALRYSGVAKGKISVYVYSAAGREIAFRRSGATESGGSGQLIVEMRTPSPGTYYAEVRDEAMVEHVPFVIAR
jgi:hypothetical protein